MRYSGENWELEAAWAPQSIAVIERPERKKSKRKGEKGRKPKAKVPFGFARALRRGK